MGNSKKRKRRTGITFASDSETFPAHLPCQSMLIVHCFELLASVPCDCVDLYGWRDLIHFLPDSISKTSTPSAQGAK